MASRDKATRYPEIVIITGMSGAGRTEAMHVFEDLGYFCVDNLPAGLITQLVQLDQLPGQNGDRTKMAVVCDARNKEYLSELPQQIDAMRESGIDCSIIFLEASDDKLIARYKSSRRRHPLCDDGSSILQGIQRERMLVYWLKENADCIVDTTDMLPQELRRKIAEHYGGTEGRAGLSVTVYSFGFKHGAPSDADLVIDVRFLPNPFYDPKLKPLTGLDQAVRDFVLYRPETIVFKSRWFALLDTVMPGYVAEGKQQLAIAVGCTGGQHRSVVLAEETGDHLKMLGYRVSVAHRDLSMASR